jgi:RNA polymerase sigma-70 factor, ECF subfamily
MKNEEFSEIHKTYGVMAYRMACHLTGGNEALAKDLVQETFLKIWKNGQEERPESFKGWIYRVLHNLHIDHIRRRTREAVISYDAPTAAEDLQLKDLYPAPGPLPLERLEGEERKQAVHQALAELHPDFRLPIVLCDLEGLSYEQIAEIVACPVGTVRSRIHRGRRELRQTLVQLAPIAVAVATALGAWFLSRAQKQMSSAVHIETAARPMPPLAHLKGESRDHEKS